MAEISPIGPKIESQPLNDNFAALNADIAAQSSTGQQVNSMGINVRFPPAPIVAPVYNGVVIDDATVIACVNLASSTGLPLYFPTGRCRVSITGSIILNSNINVYGDGRGKSLLVTTDNDHVFITYDCSANDIYYPSVRDIGFENLGASPSSLSAAIRIIDGGNNFYFNYARFSSIYSAGSYDMIRSEKSANSSGENLINFGLYTGLHCTNAGATQTVNGINFLYGSGTGNIFTDLALICTGNGISIGSGSGPQNVGDIIICNSQFALANRGIKLNGSLTAYTSNINISNCQFDANIVKGYELINMNGFNILGCIGTQNNLLTNCNSYSVRNHGSRRAEYYVNSSNILTTQQRAIFKVKLPAGFFSGVSVTIISNAYVDGIGSATTSTNFLATNNNSSPASATKFTENKIGAGVVTHSYGVSGLEVTFRVETNSLANGSIAHSYIQITGENYELTLLDEFN
ncbi:hypothetical protein [Paenibacillus oryzisoli]|uniref:Right handed beta helix domain-containing protein n=1 Tax=Paenibacillus oryzisoli TaxID=1850517 RepID=A0A198AJ80_9BACL|nr:hypothetical protein [Paenibacillus oryzisoli]OAS21130.1 hypothetical protein A8708_30025 [Paenibacillus oryzisoli]